jgi:HK97 family phage prohead protease
MRDHEIKAFRMEVKDLDEDTGEFTGYAAVFGNRDSYGDVIEPGAFAKTIADKGGAFPVLWQHDPWEPIGVSTSMQEDDKGLFVTAKVSRVSARGREALDLMRMRALTGLSIGFQTINKRVEGGVRYLTEIKLWEFSTVTWPANELALVTGVKGARDLRALRALLREDDAAASVHGGAAQQLAGPVTATLRAFADHLSKGAPS